MISPFVSMPSDQKKRPTRLQEAGLPNSERGYSHPEDFERARLRIQVIMRRPESIWVLPINVTTIGCLPEWCSDFQARWLTGLSEEQLQELREQHYYPTEQVPRFPELCRDLLDESSSKLLFIYHTPTLIDYARNHINNRVMQSN